MRMTQGAVDYRSTADQRAGLQQQPPAGYAPPMPQMRRRGAGPAGLVRPAAAPGRGSRIRRPAQGARARTGSRAPRPSVRPLLRAARPLMPPRRRPRRPDQARGRPMSTPAAPDAAGRTPRLQAAPGTRARRRPHSSPIPVRSAHLGARARLRVDQDPFGALHDVDARRHDRADGRASACWPRRGRRRPPRPISATESPLILGFFGVLLGQHLPDHAGRADHLLRVRHRHDPYDAHGVPGPRAGCSPPRRSSSSPGSSFTRDHGTRGGSSALLHVASLQRHGRGPTGEEWFRRDGGRGPLRRRCSGCSPWPSARCIRHSAGAITTMIGVVLLPLVLRDVHVVGERCRTCSEALLEYSIPSQLSVVLRRRRAHRVRARPAGTRWWILIGRDGRRDRPAPTRSLEKRDV